MKDSIIRGKIVVCSSLILIFMFIHVTGIIANCQHQVTNNTTVISAFNG